MIWLGFAELIGWVVLGYFLCHLAGRFLIWLQYTAAEMERLNDLQELPEQGSRELSGRDEG